MTKGEHHVWRGRLVLKGRPVVIEVRSRPEGITGCRLRFAAPLDHADLPDLVEGEPEHDVAVECPHLHAAVRQAREYFLGRRRRFDLALAPETGTPFQRQVWNAASQIPYGQTRSYWWVAVRAGNPYAARAVGGALGSNPIPLFVPCHRVVRADGTLGGFTPDPELKVLLLDHEGGWARGDLLSADDAAWGE